MEGNAQGKHEGIRVKKGSAQIGHTGQLARAAGVTPTAQPNWHEQHIS